MKKILSIVLLSMIIVACGGNNDSSSKHSSNQIPSSSIKPSSSETPNSPSSSFVKEKGYIYDEQDLINIKNDLSGTYYLANNISLTKAWTPIGDKENPFIGSIEGNGYEIKNLKITDSLTMTEEVSSVGRDFISVGGFIGYLKGQVKNLKITNYEIKIENQLPSIKNFNSQTTEYKVFVGALVGINKGTINNCHSEGVLEVGSTSLIGRGRLGGLVGKNEATITNSSSKGNIKGTFTHENIRGGGLVGASEGGEISTSWSSCNVTLNDQNGKAIAGGLVGMVEFSNINNCYATGNISTSSNKASTAGGLIGLIDATVAGSTIVNKSYATGTLNANATEKSSYAGGLVGNCEVLISGSTGLVGSVTLSNSFYSGTKITSKATNKAHGGAIISCVEGNTADHTIDVSNCNYLKGVSLIINGISESKENKQGESLSSINELVASANLDDQVWNITNDNLPTLK